MNGDRRDTLFEAAVKFLEEGNLPADVTKADERFVFLAAILREVHYNGKGNARRVQRVELVAGGTAIIVLILVTILWPDIASTLRGVLPW